MNRLLATTALVVALIAPASAQPPGIWDHNGLAMRLTYNGAGFGIYYDRIRPGLIETIPPGSPRFEGEQIGNQITGNAFVYTKYCPGLRFPYAVSGVVHNDSAIELFGPAAVVDPNSCSIVGYRPDSDNAHIVFRLVHPDVVIAQPPPVVVQPPPPVIVQPQAPIVVPGTGGPSCVGYCPGWKGTGNDNGTNAAPPPLVERTPDDEAARIERQGREFCYKFPGHPVCNLRADPSEQRRAPPPAEPWEK